MNSRIEKMELMLDKTFNLIKDCQALAAHSSSTVVERTFFNDLEKAFSKQFSSLLSITRDARYQ